MSILDERQPGRRLSFGQKVLVGIGILLLAPLLLTGYVFYLAATSVSEREVAGPTTSGTAWLEITPPRPLRTSKQYQYVVLDVESPYELERESWGVRLPDGSVVTPEVRLVDERGEVFDLRHPSMFSRTQHFTQRGFSTPTSSLPGDRAYRAVRIRSDRPIRYRRVIWRCEDRK